MASRQLKILVFSDFQGVDANVVSDFLYSFNAYSRHRCYYLHHWRRNQCRRLRGIDLNQFDVLLFFWDCCWLYANNPTSQFYVPPWVVDRIASSSALKVQFLQDEYRNVRPNNRLMARLGINVMFTCVDEKDHDVFYPKVLIPSLQATYSVLTGYVPAYLEQLVHPTFEQRPVDIAYRSRSLPYYLGSLAQEKSQIAVEFSRIAQQYGFSSDISVREQDRIYGDKWLAFLKSSRFSLGTESGASVVDFDGTIRQQCEKYLQDHPDATFETVKQLFFADVDGRNVIQTISPRIFEAAAVENTLVLHEGNYAGLLEPDVHYISVKKDYSNVDEVVARMRDKAFCHDLAIRTHRDLIRSEKFNYRSFVARFDSILSDHRAGSQQKSAPSRSSFYLANYLSRHCIVPRAAAFSRLTHPLDILQLVLGKDRDWYSFVPSANFILDLLASHDRLTEKIANAIGSRDDHTNFSLAGLAKDLRILALLNLACHGKITIGPAFAVHAEYDSARRHLLFRSTLQLEPGTPPGTVDGLLHRLESASQVSSFSWDHSQLGDHFILPWSRDTFSLIWANDQNTYHFTTLPRFFHEQQAELVKFLHNLLSQPLLRQPRRRHGAVVSRFLLSKALHSAFRKPLALLRRTLRKFFPAPAIGESKLSSPTTLPQRPKAAA